MTGFGKVTAELPSKKVTVEINQGDRRETEYQRSERLVPDLAPDAGRNQVRNRRTGRIRMGGGFRNGKGRYQAPV